MRGDHALVRGLGLLGGLLLRVRDGLQILADLALKLLVVLLSRRLDPGRVLAHGDRAFDEFLRVHTEAHHQGINIRRHGSGLSLLMLVHEPLIV